MMVKPQPGSAPALWLMIGLLLVVMGLGAPGLDADGIWFDEWWSLYNAGATIFPGTPLSPVEIWQRVAAEDAWQTPGYPWLLGGWGNLTGWTAYSGRVLSLLAGLLAVATVYRLGHDLGGRKVGLLSAAALGLSAWFVFFLHEMRVYTLHALLAALVLLLYMRAARDRQRPLRFYAAFAVAVAAFLYTHYFALTIMGAIFFWHLVAWWRGWRGRNWWLTTAAMTVGGLSLLPWVVNALAILGDARADPRMAHTPQTLLQIVPDGLYTFSSAALGLFVLLALLSLRNRTARRLWLLYGIVVALNLGVYAFLSINEPRYMFGTIPLLALIAGFGAANLQWRGVSAAAIVVIWLGASLLVSGRFDFRRFIQDTPPQPLREMARELEPYLQEGDVTINLLGDGLYAVLQLHTLDFYFRELPGRDEIVEIETLQSTEQYVERLREAVGDAARVWIMYDPRFPLEEWSLVRYLLHEWGFYTCTELVNTDDRRIQGFARISTDGPALRFEPGIRVAVMYPPAPGSDHLNMWLGFSVPESVPDETYSVGVHMLDADGRLVGQMDFGLPAARTACQVVHIGLEGVPAADYDLRLVIYDWQTGRRLNGVGLNGERAASLPLGAFSYRTDTQ